MSFIYGLNIANDLSDLDNKSIGLNNLGFNDSDLRVIRNVGLSEILSIKELHLLAGLTDNQDKTLANLVSASSEAKVIINAIPDATSGLGVTPTSQRFNFNLDDRLIAGAIKYNFTNFSEDVQSVTINTDSVASITNTIVTANTVFFDNNNVEVEVNKGDKVTIGGSTTNVTTGVYTVIESNMSSQPKTFELDSDATAISGPISNPLNSTFAVEKYWDYVSADISTSRVSSWSPIGVDNPDTPTVESPDEHILYGGQLTNNGEFLSISSLSLTEKPLEKKYRSEQPTHIVELYINGQYRKIPAVKGLPLTLSGVPGPASPGQGIDIRVGVTKDVDDGNGNLGYLIDSQGDIPITIERIFVNEPIGSIGREQVKNSDPEEVSDGDSLLSGKAAQYNQTDIQGISNINIFYIPDKINYLRLTGEGPINGEISLGITNYNLPQLNNLLSLNINNNNIQALPNFAYYAPSLKKLRARDNPFTSEETNSLNTETGEHETTYAQIFERLPTTLEFLDLSRSIYGSRAVDLDFQRLVNLDNFVIGSSSQGGGFQMGPGTRNEGATPKMFPKVRNPNIHVQISKESFLSDGSITANGHEFQVGDYVQYWARVDAEGTLGSGTSLTSASAIPGTNNSASIYEVRAVTSNSFKIKTYPGGTNVTTFPSTSSINGLFHEFVKVDQNGALIKEVDSDNIEKSIRTYSVNNTSYTALPSGLLNSTRLSGVSLTNSPIKSSEYRYKDTTNANTQEESDWQGQVKFDTQQLAGTISFRDTFCNIPDFSGNSSISILQLENNKLDPAIVTPELRVIDSSLFTGLTGLTQLSIQNFGSTNSSLSGSGDLTTVFYDKPNLEIAKLTNCTGVTFKLSDNSFGGASLATTNANALKTFEFSYPEVNTESDYIPKEIISETDFWGVSGSTGYGGDAFSNVTGSFTTLSVNTRLLGGGRLINEDTSPPTTFNLSGLSQLRTLSILGGNVGKFPTISSLSQVETVAVHTTAQEVPMHSMKPGGVYQLTSVNLDGPSMDEKNTFTDGTGFPLGYGGDVDPGGNMMTFELEDIGWRPGNNLNASDISSSIPSNLGGSDPDLATFRALDTTTVVNGVAIGTLTSDVAVINTMLGNPSTDYNWGKKDQNGNAVQHGAYPENGDYFVYQPLSVNKAVHQFDYVIKDLGNTSQANWNLLAGTSGVTYSAGDRFTASDVANTQRVEYVEDDNFYRLVKSYDSFSAFFDPFVSGILSYVGLTSASSSAWTWHPGATFRATSDGKIRDGAMSDAGTGLNRIGIFCRKIEPSVHDSSNNDSSFPASQRPKDFGTGIISRENSTAYDAFGHNVTSSGFYGNLPISSSQQMSKVTEINMSNNSFSGQMPNLNTGGTGGNLLQLNVSNNQLSGSIPNMSQCSTCQVYKFSNNNISTYVSGNFSGATSFKSLDLSGNLFPAITSKDSYHSLITTFFSDILTALGNRTSAAGNSQNFINLQNQVRVYNDQTSAFENLGLNYQQILSVEPNNNYQDDPNSLYNIINAIEQKGWTVQMDGKN